MQQIRSAGQVIQQAVTKWQSEWLRILLINGMWALAMYTVILAPPAMLALWATTRDLVRGQVISPQGFLRYLWRYFFVSYLWGLLNAVFAVGIYANLMFYAQATDAYPWLANAILLVLVLLWMSLQFYMLSYLVWPDAARIFPALRHAFFTLGASPLFIAVLTLLVSFILVISAYFIGIPLLLGAGYIAILSNQAIQNRLIAFGAPIADNPTG